MKTVVHKANTRGHADHGWLNARHTFSFADYLDRSRMHFGVLRVLNDDIVAPGKGFGAHPHENMEIITIPISGSLEHKDNTGRHEIIRSGDVQIMSAGTGIVHSEMNPSKDAAVNLLQIWVFPKEKNISPRYEQKSFPASERKNERKLVVSPGREEDALWINQDAWFYLGSYDKRSQDVYKLRDTEHGLYIFVINGGVRIDSEALGERDGIGITDTEEVAMEIEKDSELLLMELPV
jgi:quercetin 2,3-dioxygenase